MRKLFFHATIFFTLLSYFAQAQSLTGVKIIPGDYATIQAAVNAVSNSGVGSGGVTFTILPGVYTEQITVPPISGSSFANPVIFQSSTGINTDVTIQYEALLASSTWTWQFNGADFVQLRNLTIKALGTTYGRAVEFINYADLNTLDGNRILAPRSTSTTVAGIVAYSNNNQYNTISNNQIKGGYYGIYYSGVSSSSMATNVSIVNNTISDFYSYGVFLQNLLSTEVRNNLITSEAIANAYGLYTNYVDGFTIKANRIELSNTSATNYSLYGAYILYSDSTASQRGVIANNFVVLNDAASGANIGIRVYYCAGVDVVHNSIRLNGGNSNSYAFNLYNSSSSYNGSGFANNHFAVFGPGIPVYVYNSSYLKYANYNNYYTQGTNLAYWQSNYSTLSLLQSAYPLWNTNSVSIQPMFFSTTDLHLNQATLNNTGSAAYVVIAGNDIDNQPRSTTAPDIGADEFSLLNDDAGVVAYVQPMSPCPGSPSNVAVTIGNYGTTTLATCSLHWSVNGVLQSPSLFSGAVPQYQNTLVSLGSYTFLADVNYHIKVWTSQPNGNADVNNFNDTIVKSGLRTSFPSGTYTIGSSVGATWSSFAAAISDLTANGICGNVLVNVESGTYNEQVNIPNITGSSPAAIITFQSLTGNNNDVILQYAASTSAASYTLRFDAASYVHIKNMTIKSLGSSYGRVVEFANNAEYNLVNGNTIQSVPSTSSYFCGVYSNGANHYNTLSSNTISYGYYGIYWYGRSITDLSKGLRIDNNTISAWSGYGAYCFYTDSLQFTNNLLESSGSNLYALSANYCDGSDILSNRISLTTTSTAYGLNMYYCDASGAKHGLLANNTISLTGAGTVQGIRFYNGSDHDIFFNSINIYGSNTSSYGMHMTTNGSSYYGNRVANNIFKNAAGGYAAYVYGNSYLDYGNYNNYYTSGSNFVYWDVTYTSLAALKSGQSSRNQNSVSLLPDFYSNTNLHLNQSVVNNLGTSLFNSVVSTDMDGQTRSFTTPDMGADEFTPLNDDASLTAILSPSNPCSGSPSSVSVSLKNYGLATMLSASIGWKINNTIYSDYLWTGSLANGMETPVILGSHIFNSDTLYTIKCWVKTVNGNTDLNPANDTVSREISTAISGTFRIGSSALADFASFSSAIAMLNQKGVCGNVNFNVETGTYTEQVLITPILGAGPSARITFQALSGNADDVVLVYLSALSSTNYVLKLDSADYFTFKNISFKTNSSGSYATLVNLSNGANYNEFISNKFYGSTILSTGTNYSVFVSNVGLNENISLIDNEFYNGSYSVLYAGISSYYVNGLLIQGNKFMNPYYACLYLSYLDSVIVDRNYIEYTNGYNGGYGIYISALMNGGRITKNHIYATNNGNFTGIYLYANTGNTLKRLLVANNFINKSMGLTSANGITLYSISYADIYYNTIKLATTGASSYAFYTSSGANLNLMNNNIVMLGTGYAYYITAASAINMADYNNLYTAGSYLAYWGGNRTSLAALRTASGKEYNSKNINPDFLHPNNPHLLNATLNNAGIYLAEVLDDFDSEIRSLSTPDIGADEFLMLANDVGLLAINEPKNPASSGTIPVKVSVRNFGTSALSSFTIHSQLDTQPASSFAWSGSLASLAIDSMINIGSKVVSLGNHTIKIWTSMPNGTTDFNPANDTLSFDFLAIAKPLLEVIPAAINHTITNCNDSVMIPLKIINNGSASLTYSMDTIVQGSSGGQIKILAVLAGADLTGEWANTKAALSLALTNYTITEFTSTSPALLSAALSGMDLVLVPEIETSGQTAVYQGFAPILQAFVSQGGGIVFLGSDNSAQSTFATGLLAGTNSGYTSSGSMLVTQGHPLSQGIPSSITAQNATIYYTITSPGFTSYVTYSGYTVGGYRTLGNGRIVLLGYDFYGYDVNSRNLLANAIRWVRKTTSSWLAPASYAGTVTANDTSIIYVKLRSLGLVNGVYSNNLSIHSNDSTNTPYNVPVTLTVNGSAGISVSPSSLVFGAAFIGTNSIDSVRIINPGCAELLISNVNSSNSAFVPLSTLDTLFPGDSLWLKYRFTPTTAGPYSATSTIFNNVSNVVVNLSGTASIPPTISISPNPIISTITYCNDSIVFPVTISNTGASILTVNVNAGGGDTVHILALTNGYYASYYVNMVTAINVQYPKNTITTSTTTSATLLQTQLAGMDMVLVPYMNSNTSATYTAFGPVLQAFVNNGGTVVFSGQYYPDVIFNTGLLSGTSSGYTSGYSLNVLNPNHAITKLFPASFYQSSYFGMTNFTSPGVTNLLSYSTYSVAVIRTLGLGNVVYLGSFYSSTPTTTHDYQMLVNTVKLVAENKNPKWMSVLTPSTSVPAAGTSVVNLRMRSVNTVSGAYVGNIRFASNDPINPTVIVPCTLNIINQLSNAVNLGNDTSVCGSIALNAGSYSSYLWSTNATTPGINVTSSGNYSVTVTNGICADHDTIFVLVNPTPTVTITGLPANTCINSTPITMLASPAGGTFIGPGITGNVFYPSVAGLGSKTISYVYTSAANCTGIGTKQINVNALPTVVFSGLTSSYCPGDAAVTLTGAPSGGVFTGPGILGNVFTPANAGSGSHSIIYSYTDGNGCSGSDTNTTFVQTPDPVSIIGLSNSYCKNSPVVSLSGSIAGGTFSGSGISGNMFNPSLANIGSNLITYTAIGANGCATSASFSVTVYDLPSGVAFAGLASSYCLNSDSSLLTGLPSGGVFGGPGVNGNYYRPSMGGTGLKTITYTYTNANNCSTTVNQQTNVNTLPLVNIANFSNSYCVGNNDVVLVGVPSGGSFSGTGISGNSFNPTIAGMGSHPVTYTYTDANLCVGTVVKMANVYAKPIVALYGINSAYCANATPVIMIGSPNGGTYIGSGVSGNLFNPSLAVVGTNLLKYTYMNSNGCADTTVFTVTIHGVPVVNAGNDQTIGWGTHANLSGQAFGTLGPYAYEWTPVNKVVSPSSATTQTDTLSSTTQFNLKATELNYNCFASDQLTVFVTGGPLTLSAIASPSSICQGSSSVLSALGSGGSGSYSYSWSSNPVGFTSTLPNPIVSPGVNTTYTCVVNDGSSTNTASIAVTVNPKPIITISGLASSYCSNQTSVSVLPNPAGGVLTGSGLVGNTFFPNLAAIGNNKIVYSYTNVFGCNSIDSVLVYVKKAPTADAGSDVVLQCGSTSGVTIGQVAVPNMVYSWMPVMGLSNPSIANPMANPNLTINYTLTVSSSLNACSATDQVLVSVQGGPSVTLSNDTVVCKGQPVALTAGGGNSFAWSTGDTTTSILVIPYLTTHYSVIVSSGNCATSDTVVVTVQIPDPGLLSDTSFCAGNSINLIANPGFASYAWSTGSTQNYIMLDSTGIGLNSQPFSIIVVDNLGCVGYDTINVTIVDCTGFEDYEEAPVLLVYPNPSSGLFTIKYLGQLPEDAELSVFSYDAKLLFKKHIPKGSLNEDIILDLSTRPKGMYFLHLKSSKYSVAHKLIVK